MANIGELESKIGDASGKKVVWAREMTAEERLRDEKYMRRCLQLARQGRAGARPNPMVGAVVVCGDRIIGEGYHICQGGPHAEVNAIASVKDPGLLPESTIYVSLEPCSHYGKTPPCADLIISRRIKRCVVGCLDPFSLVNGQGVSKLLHAGVEVTVGILERECLALNRPFVVCHSQGRPYVTLKWAQSQDGMMGLEGEGAMEQQSEGSDGDGNQRLETGMQAADGYRTRRPVQLSNALTLTLMHRRRALSDAILVGGGTVLSDNPSLTVRHWVPRGMTGNLPLVLKEEGTNLAGQPLRVVIDAKGNLPGTLRVFDGEAGHLTWPDWDLPALMQRLHECKVQTLLVEGGAETLRRFLAAGLWDELRVETAPVRIGPSGVPAPSLQGLTPSEVWRAGSHTIAIYLHED